MLLSRYCSILVDLSQEGIRSTAVLQVPYSSCIRRLSNGIRAIVLCNCSLPFFEQSVGISQHSKDSVPGGDGVYNAAWKHGGKFANASQYNFFLGQCIGRDPGRNYNDGHWIFLPKKTLITDPLSFVLFANL